MLRPKRTCTMAFVAVLLAVSVYAQTDAIEQRKESIVRVSLEKQGRATVDAALVESARRAAAIVSLKLADPAAGPGLEIQTDGHPTYDWFYMEDEKKLVIDFHNTINFESGKVLTPKGESPIARVRTSLFALEPEFVSRVVLDMNSNAAATFRDVEKGVELRLAPTGTSVKADPPATPSTAQALLAELDRQKQSLHAATSKLEETAGAQLLANVEQYANETAGQIGSLESRIRELQTSIDKGTVAEPAAQSALKALAAEVRKTGQESAKQFTQFETALGTDQKKSQETFTHLAEGGASSPTPEKADSMPAEVVTHVLDGLSQRLAKVIEAPEITQAATPGQTEQPGATGGKITLAAVGPEKALDLDNQMASLQNPIAPLFESTGEKTDIDDGVTGLQLVTSVPLELAAARLSYTEDAAAVPQTTTAETSPEKTPAKEETTDTPVENSDEAKTTAAPAVVEKQAEPVAQEKAPAIPEAKPAVEAKPLKVSTTTKPGQAPENAIEDVSRGKLPTGTDPLDQPVNIDFREMDLSAVVSLLAKKAQVNVIAGTDVTGTVTADIRNIPLRQAMDMVLRMNGLGIVEEEGVFRIVPYEEAVAARRMTRMVMLKHAQAEEIKTSLDGLLLSSMDAKVMKISANSSTNVLILSGPEERVEEFENLAEQLDISEPKLPTITEAIKLNYLEPTDAKPIAESLITEKIGKVEADQQGRHLVVTDMPVVVEQIRSVLNDVDKPVKQVAVDAMIVDAVMSDGSQTGVSWLLDAIRKYSSNGDLISDVSQATFRSNIGVPFDGTGRPNAGLLPAVLDAGALTLGILTNDIRLNTVIAAETQSRNAEILANPSVVTVENQPAIITIVQEFPYQEITQGLTGPPVATTEFKDIGVTLEVTPRVTHTDDTIINIKAKQSSVSGLTETGVPIEDKREAETTLRAENGRTIFIGGLRNVSTSHSLSKIPVLGDIPLLNVMFKNNNVDKVNTELLIFLTCRVLGDPLPLLTPSQQRENDKLDAEPQVPDSQRALFRDYVKPQEMRDPMWKWRRSNH